MKRKETINRSFTGIVQYAPSPHDTEDDDELVEIVEGAEVVFTLSSLSGKLKAVVARDKEDSITSTLTPNSANVQPYVLEWITFLLCFSHTFNPPPRQLASSSSTNLKKKHILEYC
jgi:hypothetical protein